MVVLYFYVPNTCQIWCHLEHWIIIACISRKSNTSRGAENWNLWNPGYWTNCLPLDKLKSVNTKKHVRKLSNSVPKLSNCCTALIQSVLRFTALFPNDQWLDGATSNCPMIGQWCVQASHGLTVLCQTVPWLDSTVSNCRTVMCPTVFIAGHCYVQLYHDFTVLCPTVPWLD